jgi:hypothetical protein
MKTALPLAFLFALLSVHSFAQEQEYIDVEVRGSYRAECKEVAKYAVGDLMNVQCYYNYHHYNSSAYKKYYDRDRAIKDGTVKIAEFNVLHPGMSKTRYKDYKKVAQMINKWDVVGVTELLPLISADLKHNQALVEFIEKDAPKEIEKLKIELSKQQSRLKNTTSKRTLSSAKTKIAQIKAEIKSLEEDLKEAPKLYRDPGYLEILKELRKLNDGEEWALILSPRGEAAKPTDVQELVGYYYRSSKVKPKVNSYCKEIRTHGKGTPVACIPNMGKAMLGQSKRDIFSRRPFISEFISGTFSFVLLTSHVVYNSPRDTESMSNILTKSFGVHHYKDLGKGVTADNYARFAEVKVMLEFMQALRTKFNQEDVILLGDLNLESDNDFWKEVLPTMPGVELFVTEKTTVSESRYNKDGSETDGLANDYDHFLFDPKTTDECVDKYGKVDTKVENFYGGVTGRFVKRLYKVRNKKKYRGKYTKNQKKYNTLVEKFVEPYETGKKEFQTIGTKEIDVNGKSIRVKGIIKDEKKTSKYIEGFYERILDSQLFDKTYYSYYKQLLSDHMPIIMECATN